MPEVKPRIKTAQLTTSDGKCVCVQRKGSSYRLVTENFQINNENASKVTVFEFVSSGKPSCMAFCFELKNKTNIVPVITDQGIDLKVFHLKDVPAEEACLFQWGEKMGDLRTLKSVAVPNKFLFVDKNSNQVTITSTVGTLFEIKPPRPNRRGRVKTGRSISCVAVRKQWRLDTIHNSSTTKAVVVLFCIILFLGAAWMLGRFESDYAISCGLTETIPSLLLK